MTKKEWMKTLASLKQEVFTGRNEHSIYRVLFTEAGVYMLSDYSSHADFASYKEISQILLTGINEYDTECVLYAFRDFNPKIMVVSEYCNGGDEIFKLYTTC